MTDIVERLRAPAYWMSGSSEGHEGENDAPRDAADEIERLHQSLHDTVTQTQEQAAEIVRLAADYNAARDAHDRRAAEVVKLRAALRLLHDNVVHAWPSLADLGPVANARAALGGLPDRAIHPSKYHDDEGPNG